MMAPGDYCNGYLRVCHHNITGCQCTSDPDCQHDFPGGLVVYGYMAEVPEKRAPQPEARPHCPFKITLGYPVKAINRLKNWMVRTQSHGQKG